MMLATVVRRSFKLTYRLRGLSTYPKHEIVNMPALSPTMTSGTISSWIKKIGDHCAPGDTIAEIETGARIPFQNSLLVIFIYISEFKIRRQSLDGF